VVRYPRRVATVVELAARAGKLFSARGARFLGAAVAFYALLSAAPLLVVALHVVGALFGRDRAADALWEGLERWMAPDSLAELRVVTDRWGRLESSRSVIGAVLTLYGSTRLFRALRRALNLLLDIDVEAIDAARGTAHKYRARYGAALLSTGLVALLLACLVVVKGGVALLTTLEAPSSHALVWTLDGFSSIALAFVLFVALFRLLPEATVSWRDATWGALVSTALFSLGSAVVTIYLRHKRLDDLYAGAGAVVVAVLWAYYSAQVFFFGACVVAARRERPTTPTTP